MSYRKRKPTGHDQHGKRGRHRKATSPEAASWEAEHLIPKRPAWMPVHVYQRLAKLRGEL